VGRIAQVESRPRFGLVLGGGGVRCLAHLGVAEVLLESGLEPDLIASSSTGSLVGLLLAARVPGPAIRRRLVEPLQRASWLLPSLGRGGTFSQLAMSRLLEAFDLPERLEDLPIPLKVVVTDLVSGEERIIETGDCRRVVLASAALPGVYAPHRLLGTLCGDGGIANNVPADHCRRLVGPQGVVLTSSLEMSAVMPAELLRRTPQVVYRAIYLPLIRARTRNLLRHSDLVVQPFADQPLSFSRWREIVRFYSRSAMAELHERGRAHMQRLLPELQARLAAPGARSAPQEPLSRARQRSGSAEAEGLPPC
jgi:NTE family protein